MMLYFFRTQQAMYIYILKINFSSDTYIASYVSAKPIATVWFVFTAKKSFFVFGAYNRKKNTPNLTI